MATEASPGSDQNLQQGTLIKAIVRIVIFMLLMAAILFAAANTLRWLMGWVYLAALAGVTLVGMLVVPLDDELVEERTTMKDDVKTWDKVLAGIGSLMFPIAMLVVAGLDQRFSWTATFVNLPIQIVALVIGVLGYLFSIWASATNKFYARFVRIQKERGHSVVSDGPYRIVRHPGYLGIGIFCLATPLVLGSLWTGIPALVMVILLVIRTALEDRVLKAELEGYAVYARQTRFRLIPGIW